MAIVGVGLDFPVRVEVRLEPVQRHQPGVGVAERAGRIFHQLVEVVVRRQVSLGDQAAHARLRLHALHRRLHLRRVVIAVFEGKDRRDVLSMCGNKSGYHLDPFERGLQVLVTHQTSPVRFQA
jgi:hypothetical protein